MQGKEPASCHKLTIPTTDERFLMALSRSGNEDSIKSAQGNNRHLPIITDPIGGAPPVPSDVYPTSTPVEQTSKITDGGPSEAEVVDSRNPDAGIIDVEAEEVIDVKKMGEIGDASGIAIHQVNQMIDEEAYQQLQLQPTPRMTPPPVQYPPNMNPQSFSIHQPSTERSMSNSSHVTPKVQYPPSMANPSLSSVGCHNPVNPIQASLSASPATAIFLLSLRTPVVSLNRWEVIVYLNE